MSASFSLSSLSSLSIGSSGAQKRRVENMEEFSGQTTERKKQPLLPGPSFGKILNKNVFMRLR
jgi:hypothetical protein